MLAQSTHWWSRYQTLGITDGGMSMIINSLQAVAVGSVASRNTNTEKAPTGPRPLGPFAGSRQRFPVAMRWPAGQSTPASRAISSSQGMPAAAPEPRPFACSHRLAAGRIPPLNRPAPSNCLVNVWACQEFQGDMLYSQVAIGLVSTDTEGLWTVLK